MFIFVLLLIITTFAQTQKIPPGLSNEKVYLIKYINNNNGLNGKYNFTYELSDGTKRYEEGFLQFPGTKYEAYSVQGYFVFVTDGNEYRVNYLADENGFQPQGAHVPRYNDIIRTPKRRQT